MDGNWWQRYIREKFHRFPIIPDITQFLSVPMGQPAQPMSVPIAPDIATQPPIPTDLLQPLAITNIQPPPLPITQPNIDITAPPVSLPERKLPPIPSIDDFLKNITPIRPVPARSPQEEALSQYMQTPEFVKGLMAFLLWSPERGAQILGMLQQFFPRAFPAFEEEYKRKWLESERERYQSERSQAISEYNIRYKAVMDEINRIQEEENRRYDALNDAARNIAGVTDFLDVERRARNLPPERYKHIKGVLVNTLVTRLLTMPQNEARAAIDLLLREGAINDTDAQYVRSQIENKMVAVRGKIGTARSYRNQLNMFVSRLEAIGRKADAQQLRGIISEIDNAIAEWERTGVTSEDFIKNLDDIISRASQYIVRTVSVSGAGIVNDLSKILDASFKLRERVFLSGNDFLNVFKAIKSAYTDLPPQIGRVLTEESGRRAAENVTSRAQLLRQMADSLETYINSIPNEFWEQDYRLSALRERAESEVKNLREIASSLEIHATNVSGVYNRLRDTFDVVSKEWTPKVIRDRISMELQRRRLALSERGLALAERRFNFAQWLAKENLNLKRELMERGNVLGALTGLTKLLTMSAALARLSAGAGTLDSDYMRLMALFNNLVETERSIETTLANELLMTDDQRAALEQSLGEIRRHREMLSSLLNRYRDAKGKEKDTLRQTIIEYTENLLDSIFKGLGERAVSDDILYGLSNMLDFLRNPDVDVAQAQRQVPRQTQRQMQGQTQGRTQEQTRKTQSTSQTSRTTEKSRVPSFREQIFGGRR